MKVCRTPGHLYSQIANKKRNFLTRASRAEPVDQRKWLLLFLVYINDISTNVSSLCRLFSDNCILYREINSPTDARMIQEDLKKLELWEETGEMKFNNYITLKHNPYISEYTLCD